MEPPIGAVFVPSNDRFDPTEPPRDMPPGPRLLWCLHLNDPACVVGEHRHLALDDLANPFGDRGENDDSLLISAKLVSPTWGFLVFIFIFGVPGDVCS